MAKKDEEEAEGAVVAKPELADYIQAGYPCLFLQTVEPEVAETRIQRAILQVYEDRKPQEITYGVWKCSIGLRTGTVMAPESIKPHTGQEDLIEALNWMVQQKGKTMVVFHNIRHFLDRNPMVVQQLIDTILIARIRSSCVFLVGAFIEVPPELRSLITFVDCPLPTQDQLKEQFEKIAKAYEEEIDLPDTEDGRDKLMRQAATSAVGLDSMGAENAFALSISTTRRVDLRVIQAQKEQEVRKSDVLEFISTAETMDQIGGFLALKEWVRKRQRVFTDEARQYGLSYPKGILLVGVAGSGKSVCAKACASFLGLPCLRLDMGKVFRPLVGDSEAAIRMALQVAEAVSPVVMWMDEIDKMMAGVEASGTLDSGVTARVTSTILTWRQETRKPVFIVATANKVDTLPSMVYRKGRFDEVWATDLPDKRERAEIFAIHLKKRDRDPALFDVQALARESEDFVGAEIESCIEDAMFTAFDQNKEVADKHIIQAIGETIPQAKRDREEINRIRDWVKTRARMVSGKDMEVEDSKMGFMRQIHTKARKKGE